MVFLIRKRGTQSHVTILSQSCDSSNEYFLGHSAISSEFLLEFDRIISLTVKCNTNWFPLCELDWNKMKAIAYNWKQVEFMKVLLYEASDGCWGWTGPGSCMGSKNNSKCFEFFPGILCSKHFCMLMNEMRIYKCIFHYFIALCELS